MLARALYKGLSNPLTHIPGPAISQWSELVFAFHWIKGDIAFYIDALHKEYGPVVRVSPDSVDISDIGAAKEIHKTGNRFLKAEWYNLLIPKVAETVFSTTDAQLHSVRRRLLASPISDSSLTRFEPLVRDRVRLAIDQMSHEMETRGCADAFKWFMFMATDIIGELSFGESFKMLESGEKNQYSRDLEKVASATPIRTTFPLLVKLAMTLPLPLFRGVAEVQIRLSTYGQQSINRYKRLMAENPSDPKPTLFTKLYDAGQNGLTDREINSEARGYIVAGSDTTAVTLTYLVYEVCRNPEIRDTLVAELRGLPTTFTDRDTRDLPFLNQVITETLRLYSAVPTSLPRAVPPGGAYLAGYQMPGGATVSTQAYSLHRDEKVFPNPDSFRPERWASMTNEMKDASMPFGAGSRICIGIHLARMELQLATVLFFRAFPRARISSKEGMSGKDMKMQTYFLLAPKGQRCLIEVEG